MRGSRRSWSGSKPLADCVSSVVPGRPGPKGPGLHLLRPSRTGYQWCMTTPDDRLAALNITLPAPVAPVANYVPFVRAGPLVHVSGQVSVDPLGGVRGVVGEDL